MADRCPVPGCVRPHPADEHCLAGEVAEWRARAEAAEKRWAEVVEEQRVANGFYQRQIVDERVALLRANDAEARVAKLETALTEIVEQDDPDCPTFECPVCQCVKAAREALKEVE